MFEIDLEKYLPNDKYQRQGTDCFLCGVRKKLIKTTPEEKVRQALISYLVTEKGFPIGNFKIEVPMAHMKKGERTRADLIVYDENAEPLLLIECKEGGQIITDKLIDQLMGYYTLVNAPYLMLAIGNQIDIVTYDEHSSGVLQLAKMPTYNELINGDEIELIEFIPEPHERPPFKEPFDEELINFYTQSGFIGDGTERHYYPFLFNLSGFLFDEQDKLEAEDIKDLGLRLAKFGNAGGGSFGGEYRAFLYKTKEDNNIISLSVFCGYSTEKPDAKGRTYFLVAIDVNEDSHLSLELRVEKHVSIVDNKAKITHDGTLTIGKLGQAKRQDVIDFIKFKAPHLIDKTGKICLGELNLNEEIKGNQRQTQDFIRRTIEYALLRDEFRMERKKGSR